MEGDYFSGKGGDFKLKCGVLTFQLKKQLKLSTRDSEECTRLVEQFLSEKDAHKEEEGEEPFLQLIKSMNVLNSAKTTTELIPQLEGKLLLLHFFTYCCANCIWYTFLHFRS
jgi:hypothetical protein